METGPLVSPGVTVVNFFNNSVHSCEIVRPFIKRLSPLKAHNFIKGETKDTVVIVVSVARPVSRFTV